MKNIHIFAIAFLIISFLTIECKAELGNPPKRKSSSSSELPYRYRSLGLKFGPRMINTTPGTIITSFIDESPAPDYFTAVKDIKDQYNRLGFHLDYSWRRYSGLSHSVFFDIALGDVEGGMAGYSIGWSIPMPIGDHYLIIRPNLAGMFGNFGFDLGQMMNTTGYIQIGENIYTDNFLNLNLKSQFFVLAPQVDLRYTLSKNFHITAQIAYDIASDNSKPELIFESPTIGSNTSTKQIDADNPLVTYNGNKITSLPYKVSGLRLSIGAAYTWNYEK